MRCSPQSLQSIIWRPSNGVPRVRVTRVWFFLHIGWEPLDAIQPQILVINVKSDNPSTVLPYMYFDGYRTPVSDRRFLVEPHVPFLAGIVVIHAGTKLPPDKFHAFTTTVTTSAYLNIQGAAVEPSCLTP